MTALENIIGLSKGKKQGGIIMAEFIYKFFIMLKALIIQHTTDTNWFNQPIIKLLKHKKVAV